MASPELQEAVDIAYGEKVRVGRSIGFRYSMPTDAPYLTPPHQDHFYIRETDEFRMIWIPLMDMEIANGGLAIAADSHKHGLQEHVEFDGVYSYLFKGRPQKGVRPEAIRGIWTSSRFEVGDLLMFHSCAVHRALPNTSGLVRLSLNTITYPARRPTMWQAERTGPELEVFRERIKRRSATPRASSATGSKRSRSWPSSRGRIRVRNWSRSWPRSWRERRFLTAELPKQVEARKNAGVTNGK